MKKTFVTYGDDNYRESLERIGREARATGVFDSVRLYTPADLPEPFASYTNTVCPIRVTQRGYTIPQIKVNTVRQMSAARTDANLPFPLLLTAPRASAPPYTVSVVFILFCIISSLNHPQKSQQHIK